MNSTLNCILSVAWLNLGVSDQHISRFDRVVAFAFASVGGIKFITNRIIFNVGDQAGPPQPDSLREDPMDTVSLILYLQQD